MGSTITWRAKKQGKNLDPEARSTFWDRLATVLDQAGQVKEITVAAEQQPIIAAMARVFPGEPAWHRLAKALETHGTIIVEQRW